MRVLSIQAAVGAAASFLSCALAAQATPFTNFETAQVHPIRVSADGTRLFAVHTPDNRLLVWSLHDPRAPVLLQQIPVGLEPVSVMPRTADEVWVVNRLSDTVSVVSLSRGIVTDTIQAKDEPADVVFAGTPQRAFVSVAGSREVRVFDVATHGQLSVVPIFGEQPASLAVSPDGQTVWVAVHRSGNKTTIVPEAQAPPQPLPWVPGLPYPPQTGLIVRSDDPRWSSLGVNLPDHDVLGIDVASQQIRDTITGVGTTLFAVATRPTDGSVWVANTEARNLVRFEPLVRAAAVDNRITRIVPGTPPQVSFVSLAPPRRDEQALPDPVAQALALAQPADLTWEPGGQRLFVAAFGSDRIGVLDAAGTIVARIDLAPAGTSPRFKRGPRGVTHHPTAPVLYVLERLQSALAVVDTQALSLVREVPFPFDPTPTVIRQGRGFLYDARLSGNGSMACAACHIDGDTDGLAWDLGDPGGAMQLVGGFNMHPMKGPLTTQTLRGLRGTGPFHWRGDRPDLSAFNPAFDSVMAGTPLAAQDLADFVAFEEAIQYPPNPNQNLDRSYPNTPAGVSARDGFVFFTTVFFSTARCVDCHALPLTTNGGIFPGAALATGQAFKVPQLRNLYQRQGRVAANGQRTSGFGIMHDGSIDRVFDFLNRSPFPSLQPLPNTRLMLERFLLAVDTGTAPAVGAMRTVTAANASDPALLAELATLTAQATAGACDLVVKGALAGEVRGLLFDPSTQSFTADRVAEAPRTLPQLLQEAAQNGAVLSFVGTSPGSGTRIGIDQDLDGTRDGDALPNPYGAATAGCNGPLALSANTAPRIGNARFALVCTAMQPSASGLLALGTQPADLPVLGIRLLVHPSRLWVFPLPTDSQGTGVLPFPLPADPSLVGATLYLQALSASTCGSAGLAASQGLRVVMQR